MIMNQKDSNIIYIEVEQAILGAILNEGDLIQDCTFPAEYFGKREHQWIYQAMQALQKKNEKIDIVTVVTQLQEMNQIETVGGVSYLYDLADAVPTTANFSFYVHSLTEGYKLRKAQALALSLALSPTVEKINEVYQQLGALQELSSSSIRTIQDGLFDIYEDLLSPQGDIGVDTGLIDLNRLIGGFQKNDLIIIAGRPSTGKTAFALNIAMNHLKNGGVVDLFSLEMSEDQLLKRMLSAVARVNSKRWSDKNFSKEDYEKIVQAIGIMGNWTGVLKDKPAQTVAEIRSTVRQSMKHFPNQTHLIVIDYLQLIQPVGYFERHDLAIGEITKQLKNIAKEYHVPVVLLSQLNRGVESRADKRPMMSDIRDSGSVEQDADVIISLYRDDYYNQPSIPSSTSIVELNVLKNRNGQIGRVEAAFQKEFGLFLNLMKHSDMQNDRKS
uniref:Replicative DNA helicase n=1 Tax=Geobacillus sp. (strain Y4.1MC1) TaxID=581103 RepID=A0A7U4DLU1_GEOS0